MRLLARLRRVTVVVALLALLPIAPASANGPNNIFAPTISGTLAVGQVLSVAPGAWTPSPASYNYQWWSCSSQALATCSLISGATSATYTLNANDGGNYFYAQVTALSAGGGTTANSAITGRVLTQPAVLVAPAITGSVLVGTTLSLSSGTWSRATSPVYSYQWQKCTTTDVATCVNIPNATSTGFVVTSAEVGFFLRGGVSIAANAFNLAASTFSGLTSQISSEPITLTAPTISGLVAVDEVLTADRGLVAAFPVPTYAQQWQACTTTDITTCVPIDGATALTYTVKEGDVGKYFRIMVTASNNLGVKGSPSALTAVAIKTSLPANTVAPVIFGAPIDRQTLTLASGTWSGVPTPTTAAQWQVCTDAAGTNCTDISGATTATLKIAFADLGKYFRAKVTATNRIGAVSANSNVLGPVTPATKLERAPSTFGFLQVGQEWSATQGTWSGAINPVFAFQWQRCADEKGATCTDIEGATKKSYTIQSADKGFYIRVKNWITDQATPAYSEILPIKITAKPELPKAASTTAATPKPAVKKTTITCKKGKTTRKVTGVSPKCPTGFKKK
ncbi:MAG: hypothetical protein ACO3FB_06245 [Candidatus Nanopelagicaceae bacterium]